MGTRGQVCIRGEHGDVYLYRHYDAKKLLNEVHAALSHKIRWNDSDFLATIIFQEMVPADNEKGYNFGICTHKHSDIDLLLVVDCFDQVVIIDKKPVNVKIPFDQYIKAKVVEDDVIFSLQQDTPQLPLQ